jgi:uncharacterized protein YprB with RNaseH-like and TPR domain
MLKNTFCHIPGISINTELKLWSAGMRSWDCIDAASSVVISSRRRETIRRQVQESQQRLAAADPSYFADRLSSQQHWRLFPDFRNCIAYLDIETTGLSPLSSYITTIALYDGRKIRHYVRGENLEQFRRDINDYSLIVTYNGKCFDIPFIQQAMGLKMEQAHIDLRYVLKSLGYGGGLKGCERKLGLDRGDLEGVDGFFAVLLWEDYRRSRNPRSLETLLAYNIQDVVNLEVLLTMAYNLKIAATPFTDSHRMSLPKAPQIPFKADRKIVERLKRSYAWSVPRW